MKNNSAIILLFLANTISGIAQGISMLAIPWYFAEAGDMTRFGWVYAFTTVCSLFWVPYSGTFVDKYNRRNVFLWITAICGLLVLGVTGWGYSQGELPWYLVASVFTITFLNYNIHYPCLHAFVQEIVEEEHFSKMTSYLEIQGQLSTMLAGACGAMLLDGTKDGFLNIFGFQVNLGFDIAAWKIHEIFLIDGATYFVAFLILAMIRFVPLKERYQEGGNILKQIRVGWIYLNQNPKIFIFGLASYAIFLTILLEGFYLGAQYAKAHLQADGSVYAAAAMYYSVGAILAGSAIQWIFRNVSTITAIIIMTLMCAGLYFTLASTKIIWVYYAMIFILGVTNAGTRVMRVTYLFKHIPNQVYGRTNSIFFILINVFCRIFFIALFALPFFQKGNHVIYAMAILGVFLLGAAAVLLKLRKA